MKDLDTIIEALENGVANMADWGGYAGEYFQKKWGLQNDLNQLREALTIAKAMRERLAQRLGEEIDTQIFEEREEINKQLEGK